MTGTGAGILMSDAHNININNITVINNNATLGGGLFINACSGITID